MSTPYFSHGHTHSSISVEGILGSGMVQIVRAVTVQRRDGSLLFQVEKQEKPSASLLLTCMNSHSEHGLFTETLYRES